MHVPTNTHLRYQQIFASYSTAIETLTQRNIDLEKAVAACQHITWDENPSVPYFRQTILDSYIDHHDTQEPPTFPWW